MSAAGISGTSGNAPELANCDMRVSTLPGLLMVEALLETNSALNLIRLQPVPIGKRG